MEVKGKHNVKIIQAYMECTEGTSNKFYRVIVIANETANFATIMTQYGPIGAAGRTALQHGLTIAEANEKLFKVREEKVKKGYKPFEDKSPIKLGLKGNLIGHTFGIDKLKDKEVTKEIVAAIGKTAWQEILANDAWNNQSDASEFVETKEEAKETPQARAQAYGSSWGEWA